MSFFGVHTDSMTSERLCGLNQVLVSGCELDTFVCTKPDGECVSGVTKQRTSVLSRPPTFPKHFVTSDTHPPISLPRISHELHWTASLTDNSNFISNQNPVHPREVEVTSGVKRYYLLGCDAINFGRSLPSLRTEVLPSSSGFETKPCKQEATPRMA
jgi:hypothetical protein